MSISEIRISTAGAEIQQQAATYRSIKRIFQLPGLRYLLPLSRRIAGVAKTPDSLSMLAHPDGVLDDSDCRSLTVINANLWHDWPQHRRAIERLEAFARLVEEQHADVLLLQEVARTSSLRTDQWLANRLGMSYVYSRANGHLESIGFEEGVAVFSRYPLENPVLRQLSSNSSLLVRRMALGTQIKAPCGNILAFSVHLGLSSQQNARQADHLRSWVRDIAREIPALVGGDFNAGEFTRQITSLRQHWLDTFRHLNPFADGTTHEIRWPWGKPLHRSRLDYIFLKAEQKTWQVLESRHLETPGERHSDHRAVLLRLAPVPVTK